MYKVCLITQSGKTEIEIDSIRDYGKTFTSKKDAKEWINDKKHYVFYPESGQRLVTAKIIKL